MEGQKHLRDLIIPDGDSTPRHRYHLKEQVPYAGATLLILQQVTRVSMAGVNLSYYCRQIVDGRLLSQRIEVDESELAPVGGDPETGRL